ncbi:MAG: ATP-binding protein [Methanomicrobia archaeon]|nr:ATP-binding protein [Methanomicrobia archaeon]
MKRKIENHLKQWTASKTNRAFMIEGARQIGKTYSIRKFAEENFVHLLDINFENQKDLLKSFEACENPDQAVMVLQTYALSRRITDITRGKTLIFFDEIQMCKRLYSLMKPLCEMDKYAFVLSGSLLGVNLGSDYLDPGPLVIHERMFPMDFEEYLWAKGIDGEIIESIKGSLRTGKIVAKPMHDLLNSIIKEYIAVGGMPKVVQVYLDSKDFAKAYLEQEAIIRLYRNDIQQYQNSAESKIKTISAFDSIPKQFSKENHKFQYQTIKQGYGSRYFETAIDWLDLAGIVHRCYQITHLQNSLVDGKSTGFKLFMNDVGLLVCFLGHQYVYRLMNDELGLFKGAIYEQLVAQILVSKEEKLYYASLGRYEIDYLLEDAGKIYPIECKSGNNTKSKSLSVYIETYSPVKAFKVSMNNVNYQNKIMRALPIYGLALLSMEELYAL